MKIIFLFLFALALTTNSFALINAKSLENKPDIVRLIFKNHWICTGVYLDPTTILTAAHCITEDKGKAPPVLDQVLSKESDEPVAVTQINSFSHPGYKGQFWHSHDVGIIKTSINKKFNGDFKLETKLFDQYGSAILYGSGKSDLTKNLLSRSLGENSFLRMGAILFFIGKSNNMSTEVGFKTSIAPNDSGAPIVDKVSGKIIGVASTTTVIKSQSYGLPTLSTGTSTVIPSNLEFIIKHLEKTNSAN